MHIYETQNDNIHISLITMILIVMRDQRSCTSTDLPPQLLQDLPNVRYKQYADCVAVCVCVCGVCVCVCVCGGGGLVYTLDLTHWEKQEVVGSSGCVVVIE